ncbi:hypothetical protein FDA95_14200 [Clostridium botulinum]|nr:hypothetical protein [Clostridium botulinum]
MKVKDILKLFNNTVLHEWLHAKELKKICGGQNVFIVHGVGCKEKGKKLKEEYFINSPEYEASTIDGFSFYKKVDGKKVSSGRADVDNRSVLSEDGVKKALKKPFVVGTSISISAFIILVLFDYYFALNGRYFLIILASVIVFYPILIGASCAAGCSFGVNSDYIRWKNPKMYIEELDADLIDDILQNIYDKKQFENGHIILKERFYNEKIIGKERRVCERFGCKTISVLINGKFEFIHFTQMSRIDSINKEGLKMPKDEESQNDTLGPGIYCYSYYQYLKGKSSTAPFGTNIFVRGIYAGEYLRCIYGYAACNDNESLREYLLLHDVANVTTIN